MTLSVKYNNYKKRKEKTTDYDILLLLLLPYESTKYETSQENQLRHSKLLFNAYNSEIEIIYGQKKNDCTK